jgi:hypothetical protein
LDIRLAFPKRRQLDEEHIQTVDEVLAQMPTANRLLRDLVRRRHHAHIHLEFAFAAEPAHA